MTDNQPEPEALGCLAALALGVVGALLLLPGLCSVFVTSEMLFSSPTPGGSPNFGDSAGGLLLWAGGLVLGALGVWLITIVIRAFIRA
jgi:hypothetical protein